MSRLSSALTLAVVILGAACQSGPGAAPRIVVDQPSVLMDAPLAIRVDRAQPGAPVVVQARAVTSAGAAWTSSATFTADGQGRVDLRSARPSAGSSYAAADSMGLIWSLTLRASSRAIT